MAVLEKISVHAREHRIVDVLDEHMERAQRFGTGEFGLFREVKGLVLERTEESLELALAHLRGVRRENTDALVEDIAILKGLRYPDVAHAHLEDTLFDVERIRLRRGSEVGEALDKITAGLERGMDRKILDTIDVATSIGEYDLASRIRKTLALRIQIRGEVDESME